MRRRKTLDERRKINYRFSKNQKSIHREFRKTSGIKVSEPPTKEEMTRFWKGIWGTEITHNVNAEWLKYCQDEYCKNAKATNFEITGVSISSNCMRIQFLFQRHNFSVTDLLLKTVEQKVVTFFL